MRVLFDVISTPNCARVVHATVDGIPVSFERRRYGRAAFYCWAFAFIRGEWRDLGDPWPCARPRTAELAEAIARHSEP